MLPHRIHPGDHRDHDLERHDLRARHLAGPDHGHRDGPDESASCRGWVVVRREPKRGAPFQHRHPRRTDCFPGEVPTAAPFPHHHRRRRDCFPGADPRGADLPDVDLLREPREGRRGVPRRPVARTGPTPEGQRREGPTEFPRGVARRPSSREPSWRVPSSPGLYRRLPAWLPSNDGQRGPRSSMRQSARTRPIPGVWQGRPCSRPRAPSRARRPEPSTRLSCLGPGYAPRTVSGCAALSCSRTHGVFISYVSLVEEPSLPAVADRGGCREHLGAHSRETKRTGHSECPNQRRPLLCAVEALSARVQIRPSPGKAPTPIDHAGVTLHHDADQLSCVVPRSTPDAGSHRPRNSVSTQV